MDPLPQRKSPRLQHFDYSLSRAYAVTICVQNRLCLLGRVREDKMDLNDAGAMVERWWFELEHKFPDVGVDAHVVMPNHFHGIVVTGNAIPGGDPAVECHPPSLDAILDWFKTMTTNAYIRAVKEHQWMRFDKHLWQRSYYDHIIRDEFDLHACRMYIANNAAQWSSDHENPDHEP